MLGTRSTGLADTLSESLACTEHANSALLEDSPGAKLTERVYPRLEMS